MSALMPGSTIGIAGGGQLARMLALEARRMDYGVVILDPQRDCPAAAVADQHLCMAYDDDAAAVTLAGLADVVTLDNEHVPVALLERLQSKLPVHPSAAVLRVIQDRWLQRERLRLHGFPQTAYAPVDSLQSLHAATELLGYNALLKTRRFGYDGRGQARIRAACDLASAFDSIARAPAVLEAFVPFERELSVVVARGRSGECEAFPVVENLHERGVLAASSVPALASEALQSQAIALATEVARAFEIVGLCVVELFVTRSGQLLVNELAARPHNSGHATWGAADVSQFEQHLRAVCGLPLARPRLLCPAVMVNLFGELWEHGAPRWERILEVPGASLHLYGKGEPRPGRKMGHLLFRTTQAPQEILSELRERLMHSA